MRRRSKVSNIKILTEREYEAIKIMQSARKTLIEICNYFNRNGFTTIYGKSLRPVNIKMLIDSDGLCYKNRLRKLADAIVKRIEKRRIENRRVETADIPRRIYKSTIDRIEKHLIKRTAPQKVNRRKIIKGNFNDFLVEVLDWYEKSERNGKDQ